MIEVKSLNKKFDGDIILMILTRRLIRVLLI